MVDLESVVSVRTIFDIELDLSKWTLKWTSLELPVNWNWYYGVNSQFLPDESIALLHPSHLGAGYGTIIVDVDDGSYTRKAETLSTAVQGASHSVLGKYTVVGDDVEEGFLIFKDGAFLEAHDLSATYDHCASCLISWSGKYIILLVRRDSDDKWFLLCYEGA